MSREYKDSGIEWIGQIPKEWNLIRGKFLFSILNGYAFDSSLFTNDTNMMPLIRIRDINNSETEAYYLGEYPSEYIVQKGEVLIGMDGDFNVAKWKGKDALLNQRVCKLKNISKSFISQYAYYILPMLLKTKNDVTYSTTVKHLSSYDILNFDFIVPSTSEQQKIADYLDKVCGEADEMIALQEKMIDELKAYKQSVITEAVTKGLNSNVPMKESGIDWIGEIPVHWEIGKLKHICRVNGRIGFRGYTSEDLVSEGEGAYTIGGKHISKNVLDLTSPDYLTWEKYYESPEIMVKKGDIVLAQRGTLGRVALIREEIGPATINPSLVLLNNIKCNVIYLYWWLCSRPVSVKIDLLNTSTAVPMISQKQIENMELLFPSLEEQFSIASFLDTKCSDIDSLIAVKQQKIEELKEYKKSVIYEYVTGKKEVV